MAATDPQLSELIEEEFLKCKICFELYKSPRILPCLHSYCEQCLEKLLEKGKGTIYCPECRTETRVQGSVRNIKTSFFINGLLDLFESKRNKEAVCSVCVSLKQSPEAASSRCLDCADFLCRACAKGHRCSKLTLSHTVVSLQDYTAGRYDEEARLRQEQHCHSHQDTLRFFCNTCSTPICRDCRMLEHFSHHILVMADAVKARKPQVEGLISSLDNNIKSIGQQEEAVDSMIGQLKESQSTIQDCVSKYVSVLVEQLYAQRDSICKELSDFVQQQEKSYLSIKEALHNHMDSAQSTKDFSRKVMEMGKDYEILQLEGMIQNHIKRLQDLNIPAAEGKMPHLVIKEGLNKEIVGKQMFQLRFEPHCNSSGNAPTVGATDIKLEPHMTVQKSVETSVQKSVETSVQKSETPVQKSIEAGVQKSVETPVQKSVETPVQKSVETPVQKSETPVQKSVEAAVQKSVEAAVQKSVKTPVQKSVEAAVQKSVNAPVQKSETPVQKSETPVQKSETPVQKSVETPVQKSVEAAVQKSVEAPVQKSVEAAVQKSVNAPVQKSETPVQKSVEAAVQKSVNATVQKSETPVQKSETPVQKSVEAAVQKSVNAPVHKSVNAPVQKSKTPVQKSETPVQKSVMAAVQKSVEAPVQKSVNAPVQKSVNAPVQKSETPVQKSETSVKTTSKSDKTMVRKMVKIAFVREFQIASCDNEFTPVISGLSHFENGDIIIADYKNSVIKRFDIKGKYSISTSLMNIHPCGIAVCGEEMSFTSKAFLYNTKGEHSHVHHIPLRGSHSLYAIASYKRQYRAVSEGTACTISLYDLKNRLVGRVQPYNYLVGDFSYLAVNSREEFIVSDTLKKCIIVFKKTGEIINVCESAGPDKFAPSCVCVDHRDNIYAIESERIIQLSPKGEFLTELLNFQDWYKPVRITVNPEGQLIVSDLVGYILIYRINPYE